MTHLQCGTPAGKLLGMRMVHRDGYYVLVSDARDSAYPRRAGLHFHGYDRHPSRPDDCSACRGGVPFSMWWTRQLPDAAKLLPHLTDDTQDPGLLAHLKLHAGDKPDAALLPPPAPLEPDPDELADEPFRPPPPPTSVPRTSWLDRAQGDDTDDED